VRRAAALVLLPALVATCSSYRVVHEGRIQPAVAESVKAKLVRLRELPFEERVPVVAMSAAEARAALQSELDREYQPGELAEISLVYQTFGLLPAGTRLENAFLDLYGEEIAGFYDPIQRRMVLVTQALGGGPLTHLVEGIFRRDLTGELVLAHELTHALQDQHFGLDIGRGDIGEDDAQLARRAVYEGDATLAGFGVVFGRLSRRRAVRLAGRLEQAPAQMAAAYPHIPPLIRETTLFQYVAGTNFVSWAYKQAGWKGVDALLALPPRSTEQVLHPEKYFVVPEYPLAVHIGGLNPYLKGGWRVVEETTLGELITRILVEGSLPTADAARVAAGWDGDRLIALARDDEVALVWLTAWDTEDDARDFFETYAAILAGRLGAGTAGDDGVVTGGDARRYHLERRGTKCLAIEGPIEPDFAGLADRLWRRSRYEAVVPWVPLDLARVRSRPPRAPVDGAPRG
jgi:hypothetical protein